MLTMLRPRQLLIIAIALVGTAALTTAKGCASSRPNRNPVGEQFPAVVGQSLEKQRTELPADLAGEPAVLLIGYKQRAQFDIDRWIMGLLQAKVDARILEVPTIPGLVTGLASGWIDDGMRSGIPQEDWGAVVTLYGSAAGPVADLTGTEKGFLTRVIVLDRDGQVVWFDDEGYSARKALAVAELIERLRRTVP